MTLCSEKKIKEITTIEMTPPGKESLVEQSKVLVGLVYCFKASELNNLCKKKALLSPHEEP